MLRSLLRASCHPRLTRALSSSSASLLSCDIVLSSPSLRVLKIQTPGQQKELTGRYIRFGDNANCEHAESGIVVLQRFPLLFVAGKFVNSASADAGSAIVGNHCRVDPNEVAFGVEGLLSDESGESRDCVLFQPVPDASDLQVLTQPLHTGITAIDVLTPMMKGQNMLLSGVRSASPDPVSDAFQTIMKSGLESAQAEKMKFIYVSRHRNEMIGGLTLQGREDIVQMFASSEIAAGVTDALLSVRTCKLVEHMDVVDLCAQFLLLTHSACGLGNHFRRQGRHSVIVLDEDLYLLEVLWNFSTACLSRFVHCPEGAAQSSTVDSSGNSSEKRRYYAFIFQQVGQKLDDMGGGSLSLLCRTNQYPDPQESSDVDSGGEECSGSQGSTEEPDVSFSLQQFESVQYPQKITSRVRALIDRGVVVTPAVLKKLEIPLPLSGDRPATVAGPGDHVPEAQFRRLIAEFVHEIKSHTDGHVIYSTKLHERDALADQTFNTTLHNPAIVPNLSLSRVGGGTESAAVQCGVPAIRGLTAQLRGELSQVNDILPSDHSALVEGRRLRALSWMCALEQNVAAGPLLVTDQVIQLSYVHKGFYDDFIKSIMRLNGVDTIADDQQWARLKELVFQQYNIQVFNLALLAGESLYLTEVERTGNLDAHSKSIIDERMVQRYEVLRENYHLFRACDDPDYLGP